MSDEIKTKFKGPGQWRTQAKRLEQGKPAEKSQAEKYVDVVKKRA